MALVMLWQPSRWLQSRRGAEPSRVSACRALGIPTAAPPARQTQIILTTDGEEPAGLRGRATRQMVDWPHTSGSLLADTAGIHPLPDYRLTNGTHGIPPPARSPAAGGCCQIKRSGTRVCGAEGHVTERRLGAWGGARQRRILAQGWQKNTPFNPQLHRTSGDYSQQERC